MEDKFIIGVCLRSSAAANLFVDFGGDTSVDAARTSACATSAAESKLGDADSY